MISWASLYLASKTVPDLMVCPVKPRSKGEHIRNPTTGNEDTALDMGQQQF